MRKKRRVLLLLPPTNDVFRSMYYHPWFTASLCSPFWSMCCVEMCHTPHAVAPCGWLYVWYSSEKREAPNNDLFLILRSSCRLVALGHKAHMYMDPSRTTGFFRYYFEFYVVSSLLLVCKPWWVRYLVRCLVLKLCQKIRLYGNL